MLWGLLVIELLACVPSLRNEALVLFTEVTIKDVEHIILDECGFWPAIVRPKQFSEQGAGCCGKVRVVRYSEVLAPQKISTPPERTRHVLPF